MPDRASASGPGVHNPNVIDLVGKDANGQVVLWMVASGEWFDAGRPLDALKAKVNAYAFYVLEGQFARDYPDVGVTAPIAIALRYPDPPDPDLAELVRLTTEALAPHGLEFRIELAPYLRDDS